ncbi:hypothetical protein PG990_015456 [Apiospora arundinis]|uniref:Uncharacterized protein n=1 Tax=Apiospora arundinis TaxID=335852 RepID=A0ABR2HMC4_9PEZI
MPIYLENDWRYSHIMAGIIFMPMVAAQDLHAIILDILMTRTGHYSSIIGICDSTPTLDFKEASSKDNAESSTLEKQE